MTEIIKNRILLVEDDDNDAELTCNVLETLGVINKIDRVSDGEEALDYLYYKQDYTHRKKQHPAVILLDLKMPKVSGIEVLQKVKSDKTLTCIPVIILTSSNQDTDLKTCYQLGVNAYVVKPMDTVQFQHAIEQLGIFWLLVNTTPPDNC